MSKDTTRLSKEILNWYYIGDEIPAKDWSDKVAELEAERDRLREVLQIIADRLDALAGDKNGTHTVYVKSNELRSIAAELR